MTNNSSTGGSLIPNPSPAPAPIEDAGLVDFFQAIVVGLTGLDGSVVRPRWQPQMPPQPDITTDWAAIGVNDRPSDPYGAVMHITNADNPNGTDVFGSNENLEILISVYGPNADKNASLIRDGIKIAQNREVLQLAGMGLTGTSSIRAVPPLINAQWYYRLDLMLYIQRLVLRTYPVLNLESVQGSLQSADAGGAVVDPSFDTTPPV